MTFGMDEPDFNSFDFFIYLVLFYNKEHNSTDNANFAVQRLSDRDFKVGSILTVVCTY